MPERIGRRVHVTGVVQGVGFRPFVYGLAVRHDLTGWVRNTSAGVEIEVAGNPAALEAFLQDLRRQPPPLARLDSIDTWETSVNGTDRFEILASLKIADAYQPVSPDVSMCEACRRELFDPDDRRFQYPFINCTHCGPRFTIIADLPYDRPNTTMRSFPLCGNCEEEYHDPLDRRFHAQPVACPVCGPRIWLISRDGAEGSGPTGEQALVAAREALARGEILGIKGLGGFHLACDATNAQSVATLRRRKGRESKPFAVMVADLAAAETHCVLDPTSRALLSSRERPIVLLPQRPGSTVAEAVAPGQFTLGVMLPYTPLHDLLLEAGGPLVMTSGNRSSEPIAATNEEALESLGGLADRFLLHDRPIQIRCDDAVARPFRGAPIVLRRARGYAPEPITLTREGPQVLAVGGELKNAFCLTHADQAFLSHHIGDLQNFETLQTFEAAIEHYSHLFRMEPDALACDLHPDYLSTRYAHARATALERPLVPIQHHHAHVASCLAEHGHPGDRPVIGVAFDGTGYGTDATIWGGEFLQADLHTFVRVAHLASVPLPGGETAIREPWRMGLVWLQAAGIPWDDDLEAVAAASQLERQVVARLIETGLNAPLTTSAGRLFDAVAAILGVRQRVDYEAQAAIELEAGADPGATGAYPFDIRNEVVDPAPMIRAVVTDLRAGVPAATIAGRFHNGMAQMVLDVCRDIRARTGLEEVALSGGVWQNVLLLEKSLALLERAGFTVYIHRNVPPNDGGIALGQAVIAHRALESESSPTAEQRMEGV